MISYSHVVRWYIIYTIIVISQWRAVYVVEASDPDNMNINNDKLTNLEMD